MVFVSDGDCCLTDEREAAVASKEIRHASPSNF
jgi:hypothetical protein